MFAVAFIHQYKDARQPLSAGVLANLDLLHDMLHGCPSNNWRSFCLGLSMELARQEANRNARADGVSDPPLDVQREIILQEVHRHAVHQNAVEVALLLKLVAACQGIDLDVPDPRDTPES